MIADTATSTPESRERWRSGLTKRETTVLRYLTKFKTYGEIAEALGCSTQAVADTTARLRTRYRRAKALCNTFENAQRHAKNRRYLTL